MDSRSVLVIGGAGYIGSHTCKRISQLGGKPVVLDNLSMGHDWAAMYGPLYVGDAGDSAYVKQILDEHDIDSVIHFAACAYVGESMTNPGKYFRNNVTAMQTLLDRCIESGVKNFIFSSSCATYGVPNETPIREDMPQKPINPYGETKLIGEQMLHWYSQCHDFNYVALRYFNACGDDPDGEIGEVHDPETHLIPIVLQAALGKREYIEVFGTDYPTEDGTAVRDYIHVSDLADAHVRALDYLVAGGESTKLNLGTGNGISVQQVVDSARRVTGREIPVKYGPRRAGDPPALYADPSKAKEALGWEAQWTDIDKIIESAWNWEQVRIKRDL